MPGFDTIGWLRRVRARFGSEFETDGWAERLLVNETGELTPTEEFVYRYSVVKRQRDGELERATDRPGGWSPDLEPAFTADDAAWRTVVRTLERLERRELIERVAAGESGDPERTYWRLTAGGRRERERLERRYRRELEQLQLEFGMTTDW